MYTYTMYTVFEESFLNVTFVDMLLLSNNPIDRNKQRIILVGFLSEFIHPSYCLAKCLHGFTHSYIIIVIVDVFVLHTAILLL